MIELVLLAILLVGFDAFALWLVLSGAPFVPTKVSGVKTMLACCETGPGRKMADIGSGDGRIVMAFARTGAEAHGYEINPLLVWWSRRRIKVAKLETRAFIHWIDLWRVDYSPYDTVTLFGVTHIMKRLEKKLRRELKPGAHVVSIAFRFPTWEPSKTVEHVYVYER